MHRNKLKSVVAIGVLTVFYLVTTPQRSNAQSPVRDDRSTQLDHQQLLKQARELKQLKSFLVQVDGRLVIEQYFGSQKSELQDLRSVTKSVVALLVGKAIEQKHFRSLNDDVNQYLKQPVEFSTALKGDQTNGSANNRVSIKHLLTMKDGFDFDEGKHIGQLLRSGAPSTFLLNRKVVRKPGSQFNYSSASSNLLAVVLSGATKQPTDAYAKSVLFKPLKIETFSWDKGPDEISTGGYGLNLRSADLIRIGELFHHQGKIDDRQILNPDWLTQITQQTTFRTKSWGAFKNLGYGMLWWTGELEGEKVFFALGHGGQYLLLVPAMKLTLVTTAGYSVVRAEADQAEQDISRLLASVVRQLKAVR